MNERENKENQALENFREELSRLFEADQERLKQFANEANAEFSAETFDKDSLDEEDMDFWNKSQNGSVTKEDLTFYMDRLRSGSPPDQTKQWFIQLATNKAQTIIGSRQAQQEEELRAANEDPRKS